MAKLMSSQQAAERLGISVWTVSRLVRSGKLASIQIGRRRLFAEEDLEELIRSRRKGNPIGTIPQLAADPPEREGPQTAKPNGESARHE